MGTMPVVAVQEDGECIGALARVLIGAGVGPFSQGGLDEALCLAVSFGRIVLGADVLEAEAAAGVTEGEGPVARAVVGHDTLDLDAQGRVVGDGGLEEGCSASLALVGLYLGEGDARSVVDADMDELPADAACIALTGSVAGDAMADLVELAELLDVDVDQFAGAVPFVSAGWFGRLQRTQLVEAQALQYTAHRGRRDGDLGGDRLAGQPLAAQYFNTVDHKLRRR